MNEIFNQPPETSQRFDQEVPGFTGHSETVNAGPPQNFRYRRVVGTIVAIVMLAAAVTGAAIGISSRTGSNTQVAEIPAENSAANGASQTLADSSPTLGERTVSDIQPDIQSNSELRESSIPESPLPDVGNNAEVSERSSSQVQTLNLVQNTREDSSNSGGNAEEGITAAPSLNEAVTKLLSSAVAIYVRADSGGIEDLYTSSGSGIVIDDSGLILSAAHVFTDDEGNHVTADDILIEFDNGFFVDGTLLGYDTGVDIAVVRFDPSGLNFQVADLADVSELMVGDQVIAIGAPFGFFNSVNVGYVSGINRTEFLNSDENLPAAVPTIQTDAPINPGNSGGMLANTDGEVIGVNVYIRTAGSPTNVGLGFAVPIDIAMRVANKIIAGEQVFYGSLGVVGQFTLEAGAPGPTVVSVEPRLSADLAGIQPGDHIIRFEDKKVRTMSDLASFVQFHPPGEYASIVLLRDGLEVRVTATIGTSSKPSLTTIIS